MNDREKGGNEGWGVGGGCERQREGGNEGWGVGVCVNDREKGE